MRPVLRQELRQAQEPQLVGGASDSLFPEAERLLQQEGYAESLDRIAPPDIMALFRSVMDLLVTEAFPQLRQPCADFYAGSGPPLRDIATPSEILMYERGVIKILRAAKAFRRRTSEEAWNFVLCAALV